MFSIRNDTGSSGPYLAQGGARRALLSSKPNNLSISTILIIGDMDPITVLGMVAAIVQLIETTSKTVRYLNDVKGAPKDRAKLAQEATNLLPVFTQLRYRVEEADSTDPWYVGIRSLGGAGGPLKEFESTMEDLGDRLAPGKGLKRIGMALSWTLLKKDVDILLSKIERLKTLVGLALHNDLL